MQIGNILGSSSGGEHSKTGKHSIKQFIHPKSQRPSTTDRSSSRLTFVKNTTPSSLYSTDELQEFRQVFEIFDTDESGEISIKELRRALESLDVSVSEEELRTLIDEVDADGNGTIGFDEFSACMKKMCECKRKQASWEETVRRCFDVFDYSESGCISLRDFDYILRNVGGIEEKETIREVFEEADTDGNGTIDYEEFTGMVKNYLTEDDL